MARRERIWIALTVGLLAGLICYVRLEQRNQLAADFTWPWRAAQMLLDGKNPYQEIIPESGYPYDSLFYYPLTAALAALPFAALPVQSAGAVFFGLSSGLLAYGLTREGWRYLPLFLSAPYWVALSVAQWSPLLTAAVLLPSLGWLLACKPNLGAAGFLYRPNRWALLGGLVFGLISVLVLPTWPLDWLAVLNTLKGHPPAVFALPLGPLLLLAVLRWRTPDGRLFLGLSILPQLLFFYDQLILWLIPATPAVGLVYTGISWAGFLAWRATGMDGETGKVLFQPTHYVILFIYLPALAMVLWKPAHSRYIDFIRNCILTYRAGNGKIAPMELKIIRWQSKTPPGERELYDLYAAEGLSPTAWSNGPGDNYPVHEHTYHKVLWVVRGSITWIFPETADEIETFPGDRVDLPSGTPHAARVGPHGVTCLEAHIRS